MINSKMLKKIILVKEVVPSPTICIYFGTFLNISINDFFKRLTVPLIIRAYFNPEAAGVLLNYT
jgi:hypothetical protein